MWVKYHFTFFPYNGVISSTRPLSSHNVVTSRHNPAVRLSIPHHSNRLYTQVIYHPVRIGLKPLIIWIGLKEWNTINVYLENGCDARL